MTTDPAREPAPRRRGRPLGSTVPPPEPDPDALRPLGDFRAQVDAPITTLRGWVHSGELRCVRLNNRFFTRPSWVAEAIEANIYDPTKGVA